MVTLRGASLLVVGGVMVGYQLGAQQQSVLSFLVPQVALTEPQPRRGVTASNNNDAALSSFDLARHASRGFFTDISHYEWNLTNPTGEAVLVGVEGAWGNGCKIITNLILPVVMNVVLVIWVMVASGSHRISISTTENNCLVCIALDIGCNGDTSFERAVLNTVGMEHCEIHTFDIDDYSKKVEESNGNRVHHWGLGDKNEKTVAKEGRKKGTVYEFKTLAETIKLLGHENRTIDIFKIDCKGCE